MTRTITVRVTPRAKQERIEQISPDHFRISVSVPPEGGRANEAVIAAIARSFGIPKSCVELIRGEKSRVKTFRILS